MSTKRLWVDGPFKLISASRCGAEPGKEPKGVEGVTADMIMVHNWLFRGANAVYNQCENVSTRGSDRDKLDFANFAYQWAEFVHEHHEMEETIVFPAIEKLAGVPGLMDGNIQEHAVFHDGLKDYSEYLTKVKEGKEKFDGGRLKSIMDTFMPAFHSHLHNEIDTLLALEKYKDKVDWLKWWKEQSQALSERHQKDPNFRVKLLPFLFILHDKSFENGVWSDRPPIPWIVAVALRWFVLSKNSNWWRFAGCDTSSYPQELLFA